MNKVDLPTGIYSVITNLVNDDQIEGNTTITPACDELGLHLNIENETQSVNVNMGVDDMEDLIYHMQCAISAAKGENYYHPSKGEYAPEPEVIPVNDKHLIQVKLVDGRYLVLRKWRERDGGTEYAIHMHEADTGIYYDGNYVMGYDAAFLVFGKRLERCAKARE